MQSSLQRWCFVVVAVVGAADVGAVELVPEPLLPADIERPTPRAVTSGGAHRTSACSDAPVPSTLPTLPFAPGEQLDFSVSVLGVHAGDIQLQLDPLVNVDGSNVIPARGRVRTDGVLQNIGAFDVRMVAFLDPTTAAPTRMANRSVFRSLFGSAPTTTREDAAFGAGVTGPDGDDGSQVQATLDVYKDGKSTRSKKLLKTSSDVVDTLGIVYWLRARELREGQRFCFEMLHRKKLWRVEAVVGGVAATSSPAATRPARRIDVNLLRAKNGKEPRPMTVWISDDADRLPLLLTTPEHVEVVLSGHRR